MAQDTRSGALRVALLVTLVVTTVGLAAAWTYMARRQLDSAIAVETSQHLDRAQQMFELVRTRTQDDLRSHCRLLVEDPRLKSTLATEGMDEATVADILADLGKLRRTGFLMVLSPEGRVFAQAGAEELRGLDLSGSSVVKAARTSPEAVLGSWVIRGQILDLSIMAVRFGPSLLAYLVVGQAIDQALLKAVADRTGVGIATASGTSVALGSSTDEQLKTVFAGAAAQAGTFRGRIVTAGARTYVAAASEIERIGPSEQRLVLVRSVAATTASFASLEWLFLVVPILVFVGVVLSMIASRRVIVVTRSRRTE